MFSDATPYRFTPTLVALLEKKSEKLVRDKATAQFPCYKKHFEKTKAAISEAFQSPNNTTALILGVGAAQDIDLKALAMSFKKVRLIDIDLRQTKKAIAEQLPEDDLRAKFELEEADLSGILPELSVEAEKLAAQQDLTYNEFVNKILDLLPTLKPAAFPYQQTESSFVCSSLVSTQLVGTLIGYLNALTKKTYGKAFAPPESRSDEFNSFLTSVIEAHFRELSLLAGPTGRIYYADHFTVKGIVHIHHPDLEIDDVIEELGEGSFPFTISLGDTIQKVFTVVSQKKWGWALPVKESMGSGSWTDDEGKNHATPIKVTEFREYQISSYVMSRRTVTYVSEPSTST